MSSLILAARRRRVAASFLGNIRHSLPPPCDGCALRTPLSRHRQAKLQHRRLYILIYIPDCTVMHNFIYIYLK